MRRVYSLVLAVPIVLSALLASPDAPPAAAALEQRDLAQMAPVSAHGPKFSSAQDDQLRKENSGDNDERENRGIRDGRRIFRYDTFGDEQLWTDVLRMHEVIATVPPATALAVGLKVDVEALPRQVIDALQAGQIGLTDPGVTVELLRLNAVVGVRGTVNDLGQLTTVGVTCALCHSSRSSFA